jgi:hypothetical protein
LRKIKSFIVINTNSNLQMILTSYQNHMQSGICYIVTAGWRKEGAHRVGRTRKNDLIVRSDGAGVLGAIAVAMADEGCRCARSRG